MATILVVDDLAANREFLTTLLHYKQHRVIESVNGRDGLDAVRAERPDLIITDVLMPVIDGYEFVRQLRLDAATTNIPVIFHTAHYGEREARSLALSGGVHFVLTKPAEPEEVLRVVDSALSGQAIAAQPTAQLTGDFDREHLRLLTDKLFEHTGDLRAANARLRALINVGLELASQRDSTQMLASVCNSARELFTASYVTIGILARNGNSSGTLTTCGIEGPEHLEVLSKLPPFLAAVVSERQTVRGENSGGDPASLQLPGDWPRVQHYLAAPVTSPAHVYGWIFLARTESPFSDDDEQLTLALAGQLGRIYENGYYYNVAQRRADDLEHEIVERKAAESELRYERDRAQTYLDTAQIILLAMNTEGRITLINKYGCSLLGWTPEELVGKLCIDTCVPVRMRPVFKERFHLLLSGLQSTSEYYVVTKSGDERLIEWRNIVLRDESGRVTGIFSSGADITERTKAIEGLRSAEERMRFALESANIGIWDMDYTTGALNWSHTLEKHYGLQPGTFSGKFEEFLELIHPDDRESVLGIVGAAMQSGEDFSLLNRAKWRDGTIRHLNGAGRVRLDAAGNPVRGLGISMDVTEGKLLEEQYQQAQKMEAVGRLAGGVAHDFNNLLTGILGYCELLLSDLDPKDPRRGDVMEIQHAGRSAAALTRQLLAFSRKQLIEPTLLDLNSIVSSMKAMFGRLIGEDVEVTMKLQDDLGVVLADRGQVEQIMLNLVVNARDAMREGGKLIIETMNVELDENYSAKHFKVTPGRYVALTVTDNGSGMTPEVKARLFEPFFTTKEVGKGTGLGLATVHGIVQQSNGSINAYSEVGLGTTFKVYLPVAGSRADIVERPSAVVDRAPAGQTILVVEDADGLRVLARRLLERHGYKVLVAENAQVALQIFESNATIDVLLTDVVMPGASGPELTRQLKERVPNLRVVYMSGYTEEAIVHHGVLAPDIAFLHKPFTSETLVAKIREVLER